LRPGEQMGASKCLCQREGKSDHVSPKTRPSQERYAAHSENRSLTARARDRFRAPERTEVRALRFYLAPRALDGRC